MLHSLALWPGLSQWLQKSRMDVAECTTLALKKNAMIWLTQLVEVKALNVMEAS
jgi:hypothetical protein